jgi:diguanylate cyclase (GGDEF)-like protein
MQSRSAHVERHDELTGLPNRRCVEELAHALSLDDKSDLVVVLMEFDFDAAHAPGRRDHTIKTIARRLRACARGDDVVARMSEDCFVQMLTPRVGQNEEAGLLERLQATIAKPIVDDTGILQISARLGVARCPEDGLSLDQLLACARARMQRDAVAH